MGYYIKLSRTDCRKSINMEKQIAGRPICCALPKNDKPDPFINFFENVVKPNSLKQTAKLNNIYSQKSPSNQNVIFLTIITKQIEEIVS